MSGSIRSIRGIERTNVYAPIAPVNRYAAYRNREQVEPARVQPAEGYERRVAEAAEGAAAWLRITQEAGAKLDGLMTELGRLEGWRDAAVTEDKLRQLEKLLNELSAVYRQYEHHLKPELWEVVELALRHPATEELSLRRDENSLFRTENRNSALAQRRHDSQEDRGKLRRLLLGADGLLAALKRAVSYAGHLQSADLLRLPFPSGYPYAMYYGAAQLYWPLPSRGTILNKYV
ncbi:hypothetical protein RB620_28500 [Paenibacillus sp. LHD-117]|uniref:hypothetical protein n=1 Tax=Paenibacillus sp. LHD-117 TaxID=3071412 RepID=UPI0027DFF88B|nr:hypothetical protein [Paenibacillus sp. LHD-117]MDQ6423376.1 hypothetical protein [Paenibacillus sp. LHD-117]